MSLYVLDTDITTLYRRGYEAVMRQVKASAELTRVYDRLVETVMFLSSTHILSFTQPAVAQYEQLRSMRLRIGTMDLRIAAIVLAYGATLVTRNGQDFQRIPGLVIEDWTV